MEPIIPPRRVRFDPTATSPSSPLTSPLTSPPRMSSPLISLPPMSSPLNFSTNTENNEEYDWDDSDDDPTSAQSRRFAPSPTYQLQEVVRTLQRVRLPFHELLYCWVQEREEDGNETILEGSKLYRTPAQRARALARAFKPDVRDAIEGPSLGSELAKELNGLTKTVYFGKFDHTTDINKIDFPEAFKAIETLAPKWLEFLIPLLRNQRAHQESYKGKTDEEALSRRLYLITSVVCHSRARKQSNFLSAALDMYLLGSGVKRRVIEVLSGLGICHSYHTANRSIAKIAELAKTKIKELSKHPQAVVVYDNINFQDNKRDEVLGHAKGMESMTTAAIVLCPELPPEGLRQDMHDPTVPLTLDDILDAPAMSGDDDIGVQITRSLIVDAVKRVHNGGVQGVFSEHPELEPEMPVLERIPANKTEFWQLGAIYEDEGSISGTYNVHEAIFREQFGLLSPDDPESAEQDDFSRSSRLWLAHGDQLTAEYIRTIKYEQRDASLNYDRRNWLLGVPAWFHIQMNLVNTIVRTHWGPLKKSKQYTSHCLEFDIGSMGRTVTTRENTKYHQMEPALTQSFTARVLALFYAALEAKGHISNDGNDEHHWERPESYDKTIGSLTPEEFNTLVEEIRTTAFTREGWDGIRHKDPEFTNMCRMVQEIELFLTVRHAVKSGDIGLLQRLVDPLIVHFIGAGQHKYGREMLHYRWLFKEGVCTRQLQHAILASGLVNWKGRSTTHKAIDLGLEHLNGSAKIEMKCYKNSTHDQDIIFDRVCLTNTSIRELRSKIEEVFGEDMSGSHTTRSARDDIFTLARRLFVAGLGRPRRRVEVGDITRIYEAEDILQIGMELLDTRIDAFNYRQDLYRSSHTDPELIDAEEYAAQVTEEMDEVEDPTLVPEAEGINDSGFRIE